MEREEMERVVRMVGENEAEQFREGGMSMRL